MTKDIIRIVYFKAKRVNHLDKWHYKKTSEYFLTLYGAINDGITDLEEKIFRRNTDGTYTIAAVPLDYYRYEFVPIPAHHQDQPYMMVRMESPLTNEEEL